MEGDVSRVGAVMKKFAGSIVALATLAGAPALAADMPVKAPLYSAPVFSWTGCYVGGNAGGKWGRFKDRVETAAFTGPDGTAFPADSIDLGSLRPSSGVAGVEAGCRWENTEHWFIGLEGDYDWSNLHAQATNASTTAFPGTRGVFAVGDLFENRARWESSLRLSVGHSFDRVLLYATVGAGFTRLSMDGTFIPVTIAGVAYPPSFASGSKTMVGGTVGAGLAYALTDRLELGAEYRYTSFSTADFAMGNVAGACVVGLGCSTTPATGHKELQTNEVFFKLNYRLISGALAARLPSRSAQPGRDLDAV
jgi:outer membrane immunogenic protein